MHTAPIRLEAPVPSVKVNGVKLNYVTAGNGPETIVFAHGLMMSSNSYREQLRALSAEYRVVAYDHRGHGRSGVPWSGYEMDSIAEDAAQFIEHIGGPVHFGGLSMGGFVGLRLAARRPQLLKSLILMATSADEQSGNVRIARGVATGIVRRIGFGPIAGTAARTMYGAPYLRSRAHYDAAVAYVKSLPKSMWRPMAAVIDRPSVAGELSKIALPTLVMVGDRDTLLPPPNSVRIAKGIAGATFVRIPETGHLITDENPAAATAAIAAFLGSLKATANGRLVSA